MSFPDPRYLHPVYSLEVDGIRVKDDYMRLLESVSIEQHWDQADAMTLSFVAWDERLADYKVVGEKIFAPGRSVVVRAGYGSPSHVMGRYTIQPHRFSDSGGKPTLEVTGFDGFARFVGGTDPVDHRQAQTFTDVATAVAIAHGMGIVADTSIEIPRKLRKRRSRRRTEEPNAPRLQKPAGDTDAKLLKLCAAYAGFAAPEVRFLPFNTTEQEVLERTHDLVVVSNWAVWEEAKGTGGDVLFFRKYDRRRQAETEAGPFIFHRRRNDGFTSEIISFTGDFMAGDIPQSVRVSGLSEDGKRIITVEAKLRDRQSLLLGDDRQIIIEDITEKRLGKEDRSKFRDPGTVVIETLSGLQPVKRFNPQTQRREEVIGRETVKTETLRGIGNVEEYAKAWLQEKLDLMTTARVTLRNTKGLELVRPNQSHRLEGLPPEYEGWYRFRVCTHTWSSDLHTVQATAQKTGDVDLAMKTEILEEA